MIYEFPSADEPIRQGDIFKWIPRIDYELRDVGVVHDDGVEYQSWVDFVSNSNDQEFTVAVRMRPVYAIVISQDCDTGRSQYITLCQIAPFAEVEGTAKQLTAAHTKGWVSLITKHARVNQKWFYLPPDGRVGFTEKMGVDFLSVTRADREGLETYRDRLRLGRLNTVAGAHFRERISDFFRRYPYDEWYPLSSEELSVYRKDKHEPIPPYPWQES